MVLNLNFILTRAQEVVAEIYLRFAKQLIQIAGPKKLQQNALQQHLHIFTIYGDAHSQYDDETLQNSDGLSQNSNG